MSESTQDTLRILTHLLRGRKSIQVSLTPEFFEEVADELDMLTREVEKHLPDRDYIDE